MNGTSRATHCLQKTHRNREREREERERGREREKRGTNSIEGSQSNPQENKESEEKGHCSPVPLESGQYRTGVVLRLCAHACPALPLHIGAALSLALRKLYHLPHPCFYQALLHQISPWSADFRLRNKPLLLFHPLRVQKRSADESQLRGQKKEKRSQLVVLYLRINHSAL